MADRQLQQLLAASLTERAKWSSNSCLHFAADLSAAQTGLDPIAKIRGRFRTRREALALERAFGRNRIEAADRLADFCGWVALNPNYARPGALGLVRVGRKLVAACLTPDGWIHRTRLGFRLVRIAERAWATVGETELNVRRSRTAFARPPFPAPEL